MSVNDPITPEPLLQLGLGFMASKTLLSAVELGIFTALANGGRDRESLAAEAGLHPRSSADFLDALVSLDVLTRDEDGTYRNTPAADVFLDRAKPSYVGGILEMANARLFGFWNNLTNALQTGTLQNEVAHSGAPFFATLSQDPAAWRNFLNGMTGVSTPLAAALAADFDWTGRRHVIDLGGALGAVPAAVLRSNPDITGAVFELPPVGPVFEEFVAAHGLTDRLTFHGGDFFSDPLPEADVYVMGQILHDWNLEQRQFLLKKAYDALPQGGTLIVYDAMIDDERRHNTYGLMLSLNMLIDTEGGSEYTVADATQWLQAAGFAKADARHLIGGYTAVYATK
ncbi:acetylserotonin O-methyltransferase [Streptomyces sp. NBC_01728]|uniref:methyltransferase n=1 Tax=unclassified Streptomyces TaxID=2593676 RepID=UPI002259CF13|nr:MULTISPECIES: methyltransferase [unclassified Streptomyces]MCX4461577.1 acetylserotonin O-methyltransferase [Streptomyces sp. NBC_01719]MCX4490484.1 acetylserotonin O-methyltransferase [Streptomyces sp. NBC_01728]MCX4597276.1 acetylserotonin O-methyltransferase [Streptomyces sp. NBC_01549]